MRKIELLDKTGFKIKDPTKPVIIRDFRGLSFYDTEPLTPKVQFFNLPRGEYFLDKGVIIRLDNPIKYPYLKLPPFERIGMPNPAKFKLLFANNPHKCTIDWDRGTITFDNALSELPLNQLYAILFHEYSHAKYNTEKFCDYCAINYMLAYGFNPSQIKRSADYLSNKAQDRKIFINKIMSKYENKFTA